MTKERSTENHRFWDFTDHTGRKALSGVRPLNFQQRLPGQAASNEERMGFPTFQVYPLTNEPFLDSSRGDKRGKYLVISLFTELGKSPFFDRFNGMRFELYDGRAGWKPAASRDMSPLDALRHISEHAIGEREERNLVECNQATADRPMSWVAIEPKSFYYPPRQLWHSAVITLDFHFNDCDEVTVDHMGILRFGKGAAVNDSLGSHVTSSKKFEYQLTRIDVGAFNPLEFQPRTLGMVLMNLLRPFRWTDPSDKRLDEEVESQIAQVECWFGPPPDITS